MDDNLVIKINFRNDVTYDNGICKLEDTNLPLNGKYEDEHGDINYFKNGKKHNENGPAYIEKYGYKEYYINGKCHKIDGPAVIYAYGYYSWYINGYKISNETIDNWLTENDIPLDWNTWTDLDKMMFALHWNDYNG